MFFNICLRILVVVLVFSTSSIIFELHTC